MLKNNMNGANMTKVDVVEFMDMYSIEFDGDRVLTLTPDELEKVVSMGSVMLQDSYEEGVLND